MDFFQNEPNVWEKLKTCGKPVVIYGMGDGADKVLSIFDRLGIPVSAVMASDDFVRGQSFHGFRVKRLAEVEEELGDFVVALCFASQLPEVTETIKSVAARHTLLVPCVPVFGETLFDDAFIAEHSKEIEAARRLFADERSRKVYDGVLKFYRTGDIALLDDITADKDEAFHNILRLGDGETYLDLGAYNGDTIDEFLKYTGGKYKKIIALEPNAKNFEKLRLHCANMPRVELWRLGAWSGNTSLCFNNKAGRNSAVAERGEMTRVARVDTILNGAEVTCVKADVEGADYETLIGMRETLKKYRPKLNFAAYHRFEDIFRLPLLIHEIDPDYKIYLRHHPYIPAWDTNLYCV